MLVLSRKLGEVICIGNDIRVTIIDIRGARGSSTQRVIVGVEAPRSVVVMREEIIKKGTQDEVQ